MNYTVTEESLDWLERYWHETSSDLVWEPLFMLPPWLKVWQRNFAPEENPTVFVVKELDKIIGVVPLLIKANHASIIGSPNVCDYVDIVTAPGHGPVVARVVLEHLCNRGITVLEPGIIRSDSKSALSLVPAARELGYNAVVEPDEVTLEKELPSNWEGYLQSLDAKQRHEVRRKLRRLEESGKIDYRYITNKESLPAFLEIFLKMFSESREDKAEFLTPQMDTYFRDLSATMTDAGLLRGGILELDGVPVAAVLAFDYHETVYLYNSGFDTTKSQLSVGILSKALLIKDSVERGRKKFDFLKGNERYKYHLGGKEIQLLKCRINTR